MTLKSKIASKSGFSLVELLIVIGILAVIAVIAVPITLGVINKSNNKNDEVLAATYTEYMQKFAVEKAGSAEYYKTLSNDGAGSEYEFLKENSGTGAFPGVMQLNDKINSASTEEEIWSLIRKEACIVIKAYGEQELADNGNYLLKQPNDDSKAFVYYYLTGKVALEDIDNLNKVKADSLKDGAIDTEDFWIYLDRTGGSGKAVKADPNKRDFYVQIYQYGISPATPLANAEVTIKLANGAEKSAITTDKGMIVFRNVKDNLKVFVDGDGMIAYPNADYYDGPNNSVNITTSDIGNSIINPFIVYIKAGSKGTVGFYENVVTHSKDTNGNDKTNTVTQAIPDGQKLNVTFDPIANGDNIVYNVTTPSHKFNLFPSKDDPNFPKLLYFGNYKLTVDGNTDFSGFTDNVTSIPNGIYTTNKPENYPDAKVPFEHQITLTRNQTIVKGQILSENLEQILTGKTTTFVSALGEIDENKLKENTTMVSDYKEYSVDAYLIAEDIKTGKKLASVLLTEPTKLTECYCFEYSLNINKNECEKFRLYVEVFYGDKNHKLYLEDFPDEIANDGRIHLLAPSDNQKPNDLAATTVNDIPRIDLLTDVKTTDVNVYITETNNHYQYNKKLVGDYTITLQRLGYTDLIEAKTKYTSKSTPDLNIFEDIAEFSNVKKGFYGIKIDFIGRPDLSDIDDVVVIDGNDIRIIINQFCTEPIEKYKFEFFCQPLKADGTSFKNATGMLGPQDVILTDGKNYEIPEILFEIEIEGQKLKQIYTVDYDGNTAPATPSKNGSTRIFFEDTSLPKDTRIRIKPLSKCFELRDKDGDGYFATRLTEAVTSDYNDEFEIYRLENFSDRYTEHLPEEGWEWFIPTGGAHAQKCLRCGWASNGSPHFTEQINDKGDYREIPATFYADAVYKDNDNKTGAVHYKFCTVCKLYSEKQDCTPNNKWIPDYNMYVKDTANSEGKVALTENSSTISKSDKYHYQYCTECWQRCKSEAHSSSWTVNGKTYDYKDINDSVHQKACTTCGDSEGFKYGATKQHNKNKAVSYYVDANGNKVTPSYYIDNNGKTVIVNTARYHIKEYYCTDCGHYGGNTKTDIGCNHSFWGKCGSEHTASEIGPPIPCGDGDVQNEPHCWNPSHNWYDECDNKLACHARVYKCITCEYCGMLQLHYLPSNVISAQWCGLHEGGHTVMYNEALNATLGSKHDNSRKQ